MMASSNENIFHVTGPLWGESTSHQGIPLTKASDVHLWCFLWWTNGWPNNRDASDLRHHHAPYDVNVMMRAQLTTTIFQRSLTVSCTSGKLPVIGAVRGDCERVQSLGGFQLSSQLLEAWRSMISIGDPVGPVVWFLSQDTMVQKQESYTKFAHQKILAKY